MRLILRDLPLLPQSHLYQNLTFGTKVGTAALPITPESELEVGISGLRAPPSSNPALTTTEPSVVGSEVVGAEVLRFFTWALCVRAPNHLTAPAMLSRGRGHEGLGRVRSTLHRPQSVVLCRNPAAKHR